MVLVIHLNTPKWFLGHTNLHQNVIWIGSVVFDELNHIGLGLQ